MAASPVGAPVVIRSSIGAKLLWAVILICGGVVAFILIAAGVAVAFGGHAPARLQWLIASLVAVVEVFALWRVFRVALLIDNAGLIVRNYLRDYRVGWQELAAIDIVEERMTPTLTESDSLLGASLEILTTRNLYGAALRFVGGRSLNARATFRRKVNSSIANTLRAHAKRYAIHFSQPESQ